MVMLRSKKQRILRPVRYWQPIANLPASSFGGAIELLDNGELFLGTAYNGTTRTLPQSYDIANNRYTELSITGMNDSALYGFCKAADGKLLHLGGHDVSANSTTLTCFAYNQSTKESAALTSIPYGRRGAPCLRVGNLAHIFGGMDSSIVREQVYTYDITNDTWSTNTLPAMPGARIYGGAAKYNNIIYYFGGQNTTTSPSYNTIFKIDLSEGTPTWSTLTTVMPTALSAFGLIEYKNKWAILGGFCASTSDITDTLLIFDPETETFVNNTPYLGIKLPLAVCHFNCIALDEDIYIFGGRTSGGAMNVAYTHRARQMV